MKESPSRSPSHSTTSGGVAVATPWRQKSNSIHSAPQSDFHQTAVWMVMRCVNFGAWCKDQWMLWGAILTVLFAYWVPLLTTGETVTAVCVASIFFLSGVSFPLDELRHSIANFRGVVLAHLHTFLLSPLLIMAAYQVPLHASIPKKEILAAGMLCSFCLPPSSAVAIVSTAAAGGNDSLALCNSAIGGLVGLVLSPMLFRLLPIVTTADAKTATYRDGVHFVARYLLVAVIPLVAGQALQYIVLSFLRRPSDETKRQVAATAAFCSEVCDANQRNWRGKVRVLMYLVTLFLSYTLFCTLFYRPESAGERLSWDALLYVAGVELVCYVVLCAAAWVTSGQLQLSPEDRIATFYSAVGKTEVLSAALLSQVFVNFSDLAVLLLPSLVFHLIQSVGGSLLSFPLRQWRNRQHCKPGTTLLPLRYIRIPKHHLHHGATAEGPIGSDSDIHSE